jgi:hypothetical protein
MMGTSFANLNFFFFTKFCSIVNSLLPLLHETLNAERIKLFAVGSGFVTHAVSASRRPQNGVFDVRPSASQKGGKGRVLNRECRKDEGGQI